MQINCGELGEVGRIDWVGRSRSILGGIERAEVDSYISNQQKMNQEGPKSKCARLRKIHQIRFSRKLGGQGVGGVVT